MTPLESRRSTSPWLWVGLGCGLLLLLFVGLAAVLTVIGARALKNIAKDTTAPKPAEVMVGQGLYERRELVRGGRLGVVTELLDLADASGPAVGVVSQAGFGVVRDGTYHLKVTFGTRGERMERIDVEGDGTFEYLCHGSWGVEPAVYDSSGALRWSHGAAAAANDMSAGDVDGDGRLEFAVGYNGREGVALLDAAGKRIWKQTDANVWATAILDTNGDGKSEVVHSNAGGECIIRDGDTGAEIHRRKFGAMTYFSHFSVADLGPAGEPRLVFTSAGKLHTAHPDGTGLTSYECPPASTMSDLVRAVPIMLGGGKPGIACIVATSFGNGAVCFYDAAGTLVYYEELGGTAGAMGALKLAEGQPPVLLVGGQGVIWRLDPAAATPKP